MSEDICGVRVGISDPRICTRPKGHLGNHRWVQMGKPISAIKWGGLASCVTYAQLRKRLLKIADGIGSQFSGPLSREHQNLLCFVRVLECEFVVEKGGRK